MATSEKQVQANRENAKKGGVRTDEGKAIVKYNALKHGLLAREVVIIPKRLDLLQLTEATVTIDVIGCQKDIARQIVAKDGHYALALKTDQGGLYEGVKLHADGAIAHDFAGALRWQTALNTMPESAGEGRT
jgi:hypothetical protein